MRRLLFLRPSSTPGAQPAFASKGTADTDNSGTGAALNVTPSYPATVNSGDLLLLVAQGRDPTVNAASISLNSSLTSAGWSLVAEIEHSSGGRGTIIAWKLASGSESGAVAGGVDYTPGSGAGSSALLSQIYRFTAADSFASTPYEDLTSDGSQSGTGLNAPTITPVNVNRLGITIVGAGNDDASLGLNGDVWTGASETYTQAAFDDMTNANGDNMIQVQSVDLSSGSEVSGGSMTADGGDRWAIFGLALVPALV